MSTDEQHHPMCCDSIDLRVENGWLTEVHNHCTCGESGIPSPAHLPGCGLAAIVPLADIAGMAERDRQVAEQAAAQALRDAADEWPEDMTRGEAQNWLLARADSAAPARPTTDDRARSQGDGVNWTFEEWQEWSNEVASAMPDEWDGDEAQEDLILRFVQRAADHLRTCPTVPRADDDDAERVTAFALAIKAAEAKIPGTDNRTARRLYADAWADGYLASRPTTPTPTVSEEQRRHPLMAAEGEPTCGIRAGRYACALPPGHKDAHLGVEPTTDGGEG